MCGIVGTFTCGRSDATRLARLALFSLLQGEESGRVISTNGKEIFGRDFSEVPVSGSCQVAAIGRTLRNSQLGSIPLPNVKSSSRGPFAGVHDGRVSNATQLRTKLKKLGAVFHTGTETEIFFHLIVREQEADIPSALARAILHVKGNYSLLLLTPKSLLVFYRSRRGHRLYLGKLGDSWVVVPDLRVLRSLDAQCDGVIEPDKIIEISANGVRCVPSAQA